MTEMFFDKWFDTQGTSSAISEVYYSTEERKIFFTFVNSDAVAGYEGVSPDIYTALETINNNRLSGDMDSSVGSYYNRFFRNTGYFAGVETTDIDIVTPEDRAAQEFKSVAPIEVQEGAVFIAPVDQPKRQFGVNFIIDTDQQHSWKVFGTDETDAINRFSQAVELLGWSVEIRSITRFLY